MSSSSSEGHQALLAWASQIPIVHLALQRRARDAELVGAFQRITADSFTIARPSRKCPMHAGWQLGVGYTSPYGHAALAHTSMRSPERVHTAERIAQ